MLTFFSVCLFILLTACAPSNPKNTSSTDQQLAIEASKPELCKLSTTIVASTGNNHIEPIDPTFNNYIVKFKTGAQISPSGQPLAEYRVLSMNLRLIHGSMYSFKVSGSLEEKKEMILKLQNQPDVDYVEPDFPISSIQPTGSLPVPDDPYFSKQWFHKTLNSLSAWAIKDGSPDIVVAVIDTGIDYTHPDLRDNAWTNPSEIANGKDDDGNGYVDDIHGWNFASNSNDARSSSASPHGSHVAGLIGATGNNHIGVIGVAPKVKLMALKFMDDSGTGMTSNAVRSINYAIDKHVFLINNSWGSNTYSKSLSEAIARAADAKILFFAAAGNGNKGAGYDIDKKPWYPASYTSWNVVSVAATDSYDRLTSFSNYSQKKVDIAAPGFSIFSTVSGTNYQMMSGTSMATPIASGLAVLIKATNPKLDPLQIINILKASSDKISGLANKVVSGGRINSYKAVLMAQDVNTIDRCATN